MTLARFYKDVLFLMLTYLNHHTSSISTQQRLTFGRPVSHSSNAMTWEARLLCSSRLTRTLHESKKLPVHLHQLFNERNATGKLENISIFAALNFRQKQNGIKRSVEHPHEFKVI